MEYHPLTDDWTWMGIIMVLVALVGSSCPAGAVTTTFVVIAVVAVVVLGEIISWIV